MCANFLQSEVLEVRPFLCAMALMLRVGDESAGVGGKKEEKSKRVDASGPHDITPETIKRGRF